MQGSASPRPLKKGNASIKNAGIFDSMILLELTQ